jgi:hypothetical protein
LFTRQHEIRQVIEDRVGNLWTSAAGYSTQQVFMKFMDDFHATATDDSTGTITVTPGPEWHGEYTPRVFWRIDDEPWQDGQPNKEIVVGSDRAATIEIVTMDRQGGTTDPIRIEVQGRENAESQRGSP